MFNFILAFILTGFSGFENISQGLFIFILQPEQSLQTKKSIKSQKDSLYPPFSFSPCKCERFEQWQRVQLLTSLFKGEGATSWSQEVDLLEPCPSAIVSLLILCPFRKHHAVHGDSPMSEFSLSVFFSSISWYVSPTGRQLLSLCL